MSRDIKLSKVQIIQSGESFRSWLGKLGKKALTNVVTPLDRDNLPRLASSLISNTIHKFERKISGKEAVRPGNGICSIYFE